MDHPAKAFLDKFMNKDLLPKLEFCQGRTMAAQIYDFLRQQIIVRMLPPGTALSENELATHLGVSRNPVHEALARLSQSSLIEIIPQKGTFVTKISVKSLYEICFLRCAIECQAARCIPKLSENAFSKIVSKMKACIAKQEKCCGKRDMNTRFIELDDEFHALVCAFSGTSLAWEVLQNGKANLDRIRYISMDHISSVDHLCAEHKELMEVAATKDVAKLCELLERHTYEVTTTYRAIRNENAEWFYDDEPMEALLPTANLA